VLSHASPVMVVFSWSEECRDGFAGANVTERLGTGERNESSVICLLGLKERVDLVSVGSISPL